MALSAQKKSRIRADWKTGEYKQNALAKKHKISSSTCGIIIKGIPKENAALLAKAIEVETEKSTKNRTESNAIDLAVKRHMKNVKLVETIIDLGLNATAHNLAAVQKDITENKKLSPTDRSTHQRTIKNGVETAARIALGGKEEIPEEPEYDVTTDEISAAIADGLPD